MLKTIAGTQITKVIVKDKNGNILTSDLEKIVCGGKTIYVKKCNLTVELLYGFENYESYVQCNTTYECWYPLPLKLRVSWGITEKIKSVALVINGYSSECFSNIASSTEITTNGGTKEISAKRSWTSETSSDYPAQRTDVLSLNATITYTLFDGTTGSYTQRGGFAVLIGTGKKGVYNSFKLFSQSV